MINSELPTVLTFDLGTQSMRAAIVDTDGNILCFVQNSFKQPYFSTQAGFAEQHADFYWDELCKAALELKEKATDRLWSGIKGVTVTTIRDSVVCLDSEGKPLRPAILWMDGRRLPDASGIPPLHRLAFRVVNMYSTASIVHRTSACNWLMKNEPDIWSRTYKFVLISGYLLFKLTGRFYNSSAGIVGHIPYNYKKNRWMKPSEFKYAIFPVPHSKLSFVCEPEEIIGHIMEDAARLTGISEGLPVVATGSDKACEAVGLSCITPEKTAMSLGTTATVQYTSDRYVETYRSMPSYRSAYRGKYTAEIAVYKGYWLVSWFKNQFAGEEVLRARELGIPAEELMDRLLDEVPAGSAGLVFYPRLIADSYNHYAGGLVVGLSDNHSRAHMYRAIIEGITYGLLSGMTMLQGRLGVPTEAIYVAGGASKSDAVCHIIADMSGLPVYRTQTHEAAVIGSSIVGLKGLGYFESIEEAVRSMVHIQPPIMPDRENHKIYSKLCDDIYAKVFSKSEQFNKALRLTEYEFKA